MQTWTQLQVSLEFGQDNDALLPERRQELFPDNFPVPWNCTACAIKQRPRKQIKNSSVGVTVAVRPHTKDAETEYHRDAIDQEVISLHICYDVYWNN